MDEDSFYSVLEQHFSVPDLIGLWPEISQRYKSMGFTDVLTDEHRIEEYTYISQQYYKYVFSKQTPILSKGKDLNAMLEVVKDFISKSKVTRPKDSNRHMRPVLVYSSMKDDWLLGLYKIIEAGIEMRTEEEDDSWT